MLTTMCHWFGKEFREGCGCPLGRIADVPELGAESGRSGTAFDGLVPSRGHPIGSSVTLIRRIQFRLD